MDVIFKKRYFPHALVLASGYFSVLFALGVVVGYFLINLFCKKVVAKGKTRPTITFDFKKWEIHLHHWLLAGLFFLLAWLGDALHVFPKLYLGFFGGLMLHDFHHDKEWYKVLKKKCYNKCNGGD